MNKTEQKGPKGGDSTDEPDVNVNVAGMITGIVIFIAFLGSVYFGKTEFAGYSLGLLVVLAISNQYIRTKE